MSIQNVQTMKGRLLSEELGEPLYGALRQRILKDRLASKNSVEEETISSPETGSESDSSTSTLQEVTKKLKQEINQLAYMKKVKRGMLLYQEYITENELAGQTENEPHPDPNKVIAGSVIPMKRRKRAKSRALTARKGARRVGQSIRRRATFSPGSIASRLRRRSLPNKGLVGTIDPRKVKRPGLSAQLRGAAGLPYRTTYLFIYLSPLDGEKLRHWLSFIFRPELMDRAPETLQNTVPVYSIHFKL